MVANLPILDYVVKLNPLAYVTFKAASLQYVGLTILYYIILYYIIYYYIIYYIRTVTTKTTLLSTIYKRTTESTGTLLNVFHSVQTTTNDLL